MNIEFYISPYQVLEAELNNGKPITVSAEIANIQSQLLKAQK